MPVVLLFSLGHRPVAHLLVGFTRQRMWRNALPRPLTSAGPGFPSPR